MMLKSQPQVRLKLLNSFKQLPMEHSHEPDCSSGSCECSAGFVDNGNGCEEMTEEQAATTQAPVTSQAPVTTQAVSSDSVRDWIPSLINKVESVLEDNRPENPRTHILKKWQKLGDQFVRRFLTISDKGCDLADTFEDNTIDFNSVNTCNDISRVAASFEAWGEEFTSDCTKEERGTHQKWLERKIQHVNRVADKTRTRLGC